MRLQLFLAFLFLALLIIPLVSFITVESMYSEAIRQEAELRYKTFQELALQFHYPENQVAPGSLLFQQMDKYIKLINNGKLRVVGRIHQSTLPVKGLDPWLYMTLDEAMSFTVPSYRIPENDPHSLETIVPIREGNTWLYTVSILSEISGLQSVRNEQYNKLFYISLFFLAAASLLTALVSHLILSPINRLARWCNDIQPGMQISDPPVSSSREVGMVSNAVQGLSNQIKRTIYSLHQMSDNQTNFVNQFTHEIRTPLTSILGHLELIKNPDIDDKIKDEAIYYLESSARRILALSDKMSSLIEGRTRALIKEDIHLKRFTAECLHEVHHMVEEKHITIENFLTIKTIYGDYTLLKTACINLLKNSISASKEYARITISANQSLDVVTIAIIDQGKGIPDQELRRINSIEFVPRTERSKGFGLGLWICKEVALAHSGTLTLSRNKLMGTTAELKIPDQIIDEPGEEITEEQSE